MRADLPRRHAGPRPRRRTDRIGDAAAWLLSIAVLAVLLTAVAGGWAVYRDIAERGERDAARLTEVPAVLLRAAPNTGAQHGPASTGLVPARYLDQYGAERDGDVYVGGTKPAGATVTAWLDETGAHVREPATRAAAIVTGTLAGLGIVAAGAVVLGVLWAGVRHALWRIDATDWEREWALVEPEWSGRRG